MLDCFLLVIILLFLLVIAAIGKVVIKGDVLYLILQDLALIACVIELFSLCVVFLSKYLYLIVAKLLYNIVYFGLIMPCCRVSQYVQYIFFYVSFIESLFIKLRVRDNKGIELCILK